MDKVQNQNDAVKQRQVKDKETILGQLRRVPIIQVACEKSGVSRATFYRWRNEDPEFKKAAEEAQTEGVAFINDMSESQILNLIRDKSWPAISFWLKNNHPRYGNKLEVTTSIKTTDKELTPEQKELVQQALELALLPKISKDNNNGSEPTEK